LLHLRIEIVQRSKRTDRSVSDQSPPSRRASQQQPRRPWRPIETLASVACVVARVCGSEPWWRSGRGAACWHGQSERNRPALRAAAAHGGQRHDVQMFLQERRASIR